MLPPGQNCEILPRSRFARPGQGENSKMKMSLKNNQMLNAPVTKTFFRHGVPWMLAMILMSSAAIVDGIFVGHYVGASGLGAVNLVLPVVTFLSGIGVVLAVGGSVSYASFIGQGNSVAASVIFTKTMLAIVLFCAVIQGGCLAAGKSVVKLLGARGELLEPA